MIAENIKNLRLEKNLSQKQLAKELNVSFQTISHWESGYTEPPIYVLKQLKEIFNVSYEDILD